MKHYNFITHSCGRKATSDRVCRQITELLDRGVEPIPTFTHEVRGKEITTLREGCLARIKGKLGEVLAIIKKESKILVWLEIELTRGKFIHYGIELNA